MFLINNHRKKESGKGGGGQGGEGRRGSEWGRGVKRKEEGRTEEKWGSSRIGQRQARAVVLSQ